MCQPRRARRSERVFLLLGEQNRYWVASRCVLKTNSGPSKTGLEVHKNEIGLVRGRGRGLPYQEVLQKKSYSTARRGPLKIPSGVKCPETEFLHRIACMCTACFPASGCRQWCPSGACSDKIFYYRGLARNVTPPPRVSFAAIRINLNSGLTIRFLPSSRYPRRSAG